jgi:hypothetical protein
MHMEPRRKFCVKNKYKKVNTGNETNPKKTEKKAINLKKM